MGVCVAVRSTANLLKIKAGQGSGPTGRYVDKIISRYAYLYMELRTSTTAEGNKDERLSNAAVASCYISTACQR